MLRFLIENQSGDVIRDSVTHAHYWTPSSFLCGVMYIQGYVLIGQAKYSDEAAGLAIIRKKSVG